MRYSNILKRKALTIVGIIFFFTILGFCYAYLMPQTYQATIAFDIKRIHQTQSEDYRYDGYYAIKSSELFADNVMSWTKTAPFVSAVFETANIASEQINVQRFFKVKKYAPQNVVVTFSYPSEIQASQIAFTLVEKIEQKSKEILIGEFGEPIFLVESSYVDIHPYRPSIQLWTIIGILMGCLWAGIYIYVQSYGDRD